MFIAGCQDSSDVVAKEAMKATAVYVQEISDSPEIAMLAGVIAPMISVVHAGLTKGDEEVVSEGLEVLSECSCIEAPLINDHVETVLGLVVSCLENDGVDSSIQQAAGSLLMTLVENRPKLIAKKNLVPAIVQSMVKIIARSNKPAAGTLYSMGEAAVGDNADDDDDDDDYEEDPAELAQSCLDIMATNISAKYFTQPALSVCAQCFGSPDPKVRKAGGAVLGIIAEGCNDTIKPMLDQILPPLLSLMRDHDLHVREAATFAMGQIAEHCQPDVLFHHSSIIPALVASLQDPNHTVQSTSCYVTEFFCENLDKDVLKPYLTELLTRLGVIMSGSDKIAVDMSLAAIASLAVAAEEDFLPYTPAICQVLDGLIFNTDESFFRIRGRALECLGHIALAIGRDNFMQLPYLARGFQSVQQAETLNDSALKEYSYVFISNVAKSLGDALAPQLPQIVPILLSVAQEAELRKEDEDDEDENYKPPAAGEEEEDDDDDNYLLTVDDGVINTKKAAVGALGALASNCGVSFEPFLQASFGAVVTTGIGCAWSYHKIVRGESLGTLPQMISVLCKRHGINKPPKGAPIAIPPDLAQYNNAALSVCLQTIAEEDEKIVVASACEAISEILNLIGVASILATPEGDAKPFADHLMSAILCLLRDQAICQKKVEQEDDEDDNHDNVLMDSVCDLIGSVTKAAGPIVIPYFDTFFEQLLKFTKPTRIFSDRSMAIGCIGEVLDELGPQGGKYATQFFPVVAQGLQDSTEPVRRNSAFAAAVLVKCMGQEMVPHYMQLLQLLHPVCSRTCAVSGATDAGGADIDNALSAVANMIQIAPDSLPLPETLTMMLDALPLNADFNECSNVYGCICDLIDGAHPAAIALLPRYLAAFAKSLAKSKLEQAAKDRIIMSIFRLSTGANAPAFMAAATSLDSQYQAIIQQALAYAASAMPPPAP